jgi:hypothetical protein
VLNVANKLGSWLTSAGDLANPLADVRGAAGRSRAIAAAIRAASPTTRTPQASNDGSSTPNLRAIP